MVCPCRRLAGKVTSWARPGLGAWGCRSHGAFWQSSSCCSSAVFTNKLSGFHLFLLHFSSPPYSSKVSNLTALGHFIFLLQHHSLGPLPFRKFLSSEMLLPGMCRDCLILSAHNGVYTTGTLLLHTSACSYTMCRQWCHHRNAKSADDL